jgi:hypothetical protein
MSKYTPQELNNLRCMACECALKLYEQRAIEQLDILKCYVETCLDEAIKARESSEDKTWSRE